MKQIAQQLKTCELLSELRSLCFLLFKTHYGSTTDVVPSAESLLIMRARMFRLNT